MTVGLLLVVNVTEAAGNVVVVDKAEYLGFTYDPAVLTATAVSAVKQVDIANTGLDKWTVTWTVIAADFGTYRGKSATTLAGDAKTAINAVTDPDAV